MVVILGGGGGSSNKRPPNAKGTVTGTGTFEDPYCLVMGEPMIDIYYSGDEDPFFFKFTSGSGISGNYIVNRNVDRKRVRFTLQSTSESALRVTAAEGLKYVQAGAKCFTLTEAKKSGDTKDVQTPYYKITSTETFNMGGGDVTAGGVKEYYRKRELGNGYLVIDGEGGTLASNKSNYGTAYVFCKDKITVSQAYQYITDEQKEVIPIDYQTIVKTDDGDYEQTVSYYYLGSGKFKNVNTGAELSAYSTMDIIYELGSAVSDDTLGRTEGMKKVGLEALQLISKIIVSIADIVVKNFLKDNLAGVNDTDGASISDYVTIDSLIFNKFGNTKVDLFGSDGGDINNAAKPVIETWYHIFRAWAIILDTLFVVYIGIRSLLYTGSANEQKIKPMIEGWIIAIALMYAMPIVMKYSIKVNNGMIEVIKMNNPNDVYSYYLYSDIWPEKFEEGEDTGGSLLEDLRSKRDEITKTLAEKEDEKRRLRNEKARINNELREIKNNIEQLNRDLAEWEGYETKYNKEMADNLDALFNSLQETRLNINNFSGGPFKIVDKDGNEVVYDANMGQIFVRILRRLV